VDAAVPAFAIHSGKVPPAINTRKNIDGQKLNVSPEAREMKVGVAISSVYSTGGQNAALVFKKVQ
jgi:3-oxoacyl-(acyl-carrier-protein) synthase